MVTILEPLGQSLGLDVDFHVATCFIEVEGKILVLQRGRKDEQFALWGIPGGKVEYGEEPRKAISREVFEETGILANGLDFCFLDKALSKNKFDGSYVLYLYYLKLPEKPSILINQDEHLDYRWVTLKDFESLDLLISQRLAYKFVYKKVKEKMEGS